MRKMVVFLRYLCFLQFCVVIYSDVMTTFPTKGCKNCSICHLSGTCLRCMARYYLKRGRCYACPTNCISCKNETTCYKCVDGYYGPACEQHCGVGCVNNTCEQKKGLCTCRTGCFLDKCETCLTDEHIDECTFNCLHCLCKGSQCKCIECMPEYYKNDNFCYKNCSKGTWGILCRNKCPESCSVCDSKSGACITCSDGKYSTNCSEDCSPNCMAATNVPLCDAVTGACAAGCTSSNRFGNYCNETCSSHCIDEKCDWKTGSCLNGCRPDYFGEFCHKICPHNCATTFGSRCEVENGTCIEGCDSGYFGSDCSLECSRNCLGVECDSNSGHCTYGCNQGFTGEKCRKALADTPIGGSAASQSNATSWIGAAIGGALAMLVLGGGVILIVVLLRRRKRRMQQSENTGIVLNSTNEIDQVEDLPPEYVEVVDTDLVEENTTEDKGIHEHDATYVNQPNIKADTGASVYEQLQNRDKNEQQYETVSTTIYENTSR